MLPTLAVDWRASELRGEEVGCFPRSSWRVHRCCGRSAFAVDNLTVDTRVTFQSIEKHLVVLWMLASFLLYSENVPQKVVSNFTTEA